MLRIGTSICCLTLTKKSVYDIGLLFARTSQTYTIPLIEASTVSDISDIWIYSLSLTGATTMPRAPFLLKDKIGKWSPWSFSQTPPPKWSRDHFFLLFYFYILPLSSHSLVIPSIYLSIFSNLNIYKFHSKRITSDALYSSVALQECTWSSIIEVNFNTLRYFFFLLKNYFSFSQ